MHAPKAIRWRGEFREGSRVTKAARVLKISEDVAW